MKRFGVEGIAGGQTFHGNGEYNDQEDAKCGGEPINPK